MIVWSSEFNTTTSWMNICINVCMNGLLLLCVCVLCTATLIYKYTTTLRYTQRYNKNSWVNLFNFLSFFLFIYKWVLTVDIECDDMNLKDGGDKKLTWKTMLYNSAIHSAIIGYTIYITIISFSNGIYLFSYHPPLMLAGVSVLCIKHCLIFFHLQK